MGVNRLENKRRVSSVQYHSRGRYAEQKKYKLPQNAARGVE